jgi:hypothetical protein
MTGDRITYHHSQDRRQYFFSTEHLQSTPEDFVAVTAHLPHSVVARLGLESGWVTTVEEYKFVFLGDSCEIPNPDPRFKSPYAAVSDEDRKCVWELCVLIMQCDRYRDDVEYRAAVDLVFLKFKPTRDDIVRWIS